MSDYFVWAVSGAMPKGLFAFLQWAIAFLGCDRFFTMSDYFVWTIAFLGAIGFVVVVRWAFLARIYAEINHSNDFTHPTVDMCGRSLFWWAIHSYSLTTYSRDFMKLCYDNSYSVFTQTCIFTFFKIIMTIKIAETLDLTIQYITNQNGEKIAVIVPIEQFNQIFKKTTNEPAEKNHPVTNQEVTQDDIWNIAKKITKDMTEEELQQLPIDGSQQHDHYIYGTPKK